jgi:hypothetical protein
VEHVADNFHFNDVEHHTWHKRNYGGFRCSALRKNRFHWFNWKLAHLLAHNMKSRLFFHFFFFCAIFLAQLQANDLLTTSEKTTEKVTKQQAPTPRTDTPAVKFTPPPTGNDARVISPLGSSKAAAVEGSVRVMKKNGAPIEVAMNGASMEI